MRPVGLAILSIFRLVVGTLVFIAGIVFVALSATVASTPAAAEEIARNFSLLPGIPLGLHRLFAPEVVVLFLGTVIVVIGITMAAIGWGLWIGANLARWIAIIFFGWNALSSLFNLLQGQVGSIISLALNALIVYYLFLPQVKRFFEASI